MVEAKRTGHDLANSVGACFWPWSWLAPGSVLACSWSAPHLLLARSWPVPDSANKTRLAGELVSLRDMGLSGEVSVLFSSGILNELQSSPVFPVLFSAVCPALFPVFFKMLFPTLLPSLLSIA